jgi:hypothetical protein
LSRFLPVLPIAVAVLLNVACSQPRTAPCPRSQAAFRLQVTAIDGNLPVDTELTVSYQGSRQERYDFYDMGAGNVDVCCRPSGSAWPATAALPTVACTPGSSPDASVAPNVEDAGSRAALVCQLWTSGPAEVDVTATGYAELDQVLQAELLDNGCGVQTTDVRVTLERPDGAPTQ